MTRRTGGRAMGNGRKFKPLHGSKTAVEKHILRWYQEEFRRKNKEAMLREIERKRLEEQVVIERRDLRT